MMKEEPQSPGFEDDVSLSPASVKGEEFEDDDKYEDSLDLDTTQAHSNVWMVRMPRFLLEQWKDVDYFGGRELGKVRIKRQQDDKQWKVRLTLNDSERTHDLPHDYDLTLVQQVVQNTYVFKEQDLPQSSGRTGSAEANSSNPQDRDANYDKYQPVIRHLPKRTALVGQACHECVVTPDFRDPNYSNVVKRRKIMEQPDSERQVTLLNDTAGVGGVKYGATLRQQRNVWLKAQNKRDMLRQGDGKAIRIPKSELLDKLFGLFEETEYWTLKGLRERTRQPEAYLKEVLDTIAILNKKGPYATKYGLRSDFKQHKGTGIAMQQMLEAGGTLEDPETKEEPSDDDMETIF
ncbi:Transcription initiation factor IIF subunit beta [Wickerhamiella sorbophila]|uniref:Transcription initiation factor IIF subunit beta n=1 Tax=Wickerhamiella sorbophila TaxID=45607 RepID=A0A2T0FLG9_9ASCO|nr:Transcription initiation factor IIF subunit beta [Wickerhamiella sorbophila]PRT55825.1 Transcription initiation factor IIF subunit beta [Wickerhamiella sorbophila]